MIYDIKRRTLKRGKIARRELTTLEGKFLESFKDNKLVLYSELAKNMYGIESEILEDSIKEIKSKIIKKYKIRFKTRYKLGYILLSNIKFI